MSPDYDHLPLMNKVEVFEHSLELTQGDDLAKLMLLKSPSSEVWFDRRTNFTRSLAVMSMVGYVLGLGKFKRLCGYNMGEWRNSSYGGGAGGGAQKTFYCPYDMVYW